MAGQGVQPGNPAASRSNLPVLPPVGCSPWITSAFPQYFGCGDGSEGIEQQGERWGHRGG